MTDPTIYVLDSKLRTSGTVQDALYNMIASGTIGPGTFELISYHSKNQVGNVELGVNDEIYFDEGGAELGPVNLTPGYYTEAELATEIDVQMNSAGGANTYVTTYSDITGKFLIDGGGASTYKFNWDVNQAQPLAQQLMGFSAAVGVLANTQTSDLVADLTLHQMLFIKVVQDGQNAVTAQTGIEYTFAIPLVGAYQEDIDSTKQLTYSQTMTLSTNVNNLEVELYTEDGNALVNTPQYQLAIRKLF